MRYFLLLHIITLSCLYSYATTSADFIEKNNFLSGNQKNTLEVFTPSNKHTGFYELAKIWDDRKPSQLGKMSSPTIPKIIHQVWIGSAPLPPRYKVYIKECKALHPDWEYKLWTEKEIENWNFATKDLYLKARNYQEKTNIIRVAAVQQYGGIYLDTDILCIKPFDALLEYYDFFAGLEPNFINHWIPVMNNAFIAAKPNHPLFTEYFQSLRDNWDQRIIEYENQTLDEPLYYLLSRISLNNSFPQFSRSIMHHLRNNNDRSVVLPIEYLFPFFSHHQRNSAQDISEFTFSAHDYTKSMRLIEFLPLTFKLDEDKQRTRHFVLHQKYNKFQHYDYRPNTIAKTMHFINTTVQNISPKWTKGQYRTWNQKFWNTGNLQQVLSTEQWSLLNRTQNIDAFELLSGIMLLHQFGGVYINNNSIPGQENLFDLIYTLDFFAGLTNMDTESPTASSKALGSKPNHEITMRVLETIAAHKGKITVKHIQDAIWNKGYEYINIDGQNSFLPQQYFEPKKAEEYSIIR